MYNNLLNELSRVKRHKRQRVKKNTADELFAFYILERHWMDDEYIISPYGFDREYWLYGGVYGLFDDCTEVDDPVFYIGQSKNIKRRIGQHFRDEKSRFHKIKNTLTVGDERPFLILLSGNTKDEGYYHRVISESPYWRSINVESRLLKY